jgi:hypothetical protein
VGFLLLIITRIGFVVINYLPLGEDVMINRFIGENMVAFAVVPYTFILLGLYFLYQAINTFIGGDGE